jgi:hypothetical protein
MRKCISLIFYTKDNVAFYLPRPLHFLSYQSNRLLRRSDLHRKNSDIRIVLMTFHFLKPKTERAFLNSSMDQSVESVFYQNVVILLLDLC